MLFLQQLTQEKNELREEKASLRSNIQDLKSQQHQPTQGFMVPCATVDSSILMAPSYPFPVAVSVPPGSIPVHQTIQPLPSYPNQHTATSTFIPYLAPVIPQINHSTLTASTSYISGPTASSTRSISEQRSSRSKTGNSNDVATDLELKIPGSAAPKVGFLSTRTYDILKINAGFPSLNYFSQNVQGLSTREKGKQPERHQEKSATNGNSSSKSSSQVFQGSSSDSIDDDEWGLINLQRLACCFNVDDRKSFSADKDRLSALLICLANNTLTSNPRHVHTVSTTLQQNRKSCCMLYSLTCFFWSYLIG